MPRRLVEDESGLALALAILMVVLINCTDLQPNDEGPLLGHAGAGAGG
jgi:hypothetical protein